ncbi:Hypp3084 [Branchiostoma lanceolatum]|uniref:Hypp3084 protein n=1 Tax=Branchiostoma lanceolatum TaxID=7740 RepID=A0A8K0EVK6_BRALA|nr:Hypp3084 [Branchiostoma lanceolatum]
MRTSDHRRLTHRDSWPFPRLFLLRRSPPAARGKGRREQRPSPPRGGTQPVGRPPIFGAKRPATDGAQGPGLPGTTDDGGRRGSTGPQATLGSTGPLTTVSQPTVPPDLQPE